MLKRFFRFIYRILHIYFGNKDRVQRIQEKKQKLDKKILRDINRRTGRNKRKRIRKKK